MSQSKIWVVSDHHLGHANILKFTDSATGKRVRPEFDDTDQMNEAILTRHNEAVAEHDIVYFLGDLGFKRPILERYLPLFKGKKRLILGNHDNEDMSFYTRYFHKIVGWRQFKLDNVFMVLSHVPLHESGFVYRTDRLSCNIHGHIHHNVINDPHYINVCVEHTNYTPVLLDDLLERAKKQLKVK